MLISLSAERGVTAQSNSEFLRFFDGQKAKKERDGMRT
jgi:hypothetical protein